MREVVYLLHGLGRTCLSMAWIGRYLHRAGFEIRPFRYYSTRRPADHHAGLLHKELMRADQEADLGAIHFVTHSMGGIVTRAALNRGMPARIGRVVMLAPPNQGSDIARRLAPWLGWMLRPLPELSCDPASYVCRLGVPVDVEIGIIAGSMDNKVSLEQTHLPGETAHLIVPARHTFIMNRGDVCRQTACFLRQGRFATT